MTTKKIWVFALGLCLMAGLLAGCGGPGGDVGLAKNGVEMLIANNPAAADTLEWETFQFMGELPGSQYSMLLNDTQKAAFKTSFIASAAAKFQSMHANADTFSNWRVREEDATKTVVVADTHHEAKLLVTVLKRNGNPKIWSISIGM